MYFELKNAQKATENLKKTYNINDIFNSCQNEDDFSKTLLYEEVPSYYTYNKKMVVFNVNIEVLFSQPIKIDHVTSECNKSYSELICYETMQLKLLF